MKQIFTFCSLLLSGLALSQEGTLDTSYGNSGFYIYNSGSYGTEIEIDANQRMVVGTYEFSHAFKFYRFSSSNQLDTSFGSGGYTAVYFGGLEAVLYDMKIQPDGKIVAVGYWEDANSINRKDFMVVRLNANGTLDTSFNGTGKLTIAFGTNEDIAKAVAIQPDGKILVAGQSYTGSNRDVAVARINVDGTLDTTFSGDGKVTTDITGNNDSATCIAINTDGKIAVGSYSYGASASGSDYGIVKYNADGSLDTSFSGDGKQLIVLSSNDNDEPVEIAFLNNGKILIGGTAFLSLNGRDDFALVRLNANGSLDTSFNGDGIFTASIGSSDDTTHAMKILADGKILLAGAVTAGSYTDIGLMRVTSNGYLDTTFGNNGKIQQGYGNLSGIQDMDVLSDGKIMVCGSAGGTNIFLSRFNGTVPAYLDAKDIAAD
ncbi:delta-60 repeat domain-containing protein, partial [uncultured Chryseobacterium sp.]|uniref:delta-60 repeat domain-containing protein n=1 Tax=uncultured Chryseobacterium sp. TaxID=259322 RepID=UPI0025CEB441